MIVFLDNMGLPVFRNERSKPPMPISAPPAPTSKNRGFVKPCMDKIMGNKNIVMPAMP